MVSGIQEADFTDFALADLGVTVSRAAVTIAKDNITDDETKTYGTPANITAYFVRKAQSWYFDKEGRVEGGDAFMAVDKDQAMAVEDKITVGGESFIVKNVIVRKAGATEMFKSVNLFLTT